ncbi:type II toxin-antitoxin system VapC family toxin [candidate division KSB1 bacterium]|nr:type II toxin-antitoxin system VapC family toxin [candidate division KSB1 bacterium]
MAAETILIDTSILIDFFRQREKSESVLMQLSDQNRLCISAITAFEVRIGIRTQVQQSDYDLLAQNIEILPIDDSCIDAAVVIYKSLRPQNALIELADLLIGATAVSNSLPLATLNRKHFERIGNLTLINFP